MAQNDTNTKIQDIKDLIGDFCKARSWEKFHNPRDLATGASIEASELLELFIFKTNEQIQEAMNNDEQFRTRVKEELADVLVYCIHFAGHNNIDIAQAIKEKMIKNGKKYPAENGDNIEKYFKNKIGQ